jgi:hypothetical protein
MVLEGSLSCPQMHVTGPYLGVEYQVYILKLFKIRFNIILLLLLVVVVVVSFC